MDRTREGFGQMENQGKGSGGLTYEEQEAFAGTSRSSVSMIALSRLDYVKTDVARNSEIAKSILKLRECRDQLAQRKKLWSH